MMSPSLTRCVELARALRGAIFRPRIVRQSVMLAHGAVAVFSTAC